MKKKKNNNNNSVEMLKVEPPQMVVEFTVFGGKEAKL